jgi:hypothetical protein
MKKIPYIHILLQAKLLFRSFKRDAERIFFKKTHLYIYIYIYINSFSVLHVVSLGDTLHNVVC